MPKNTVNANFNQIAVTDASDNVLGIRAAIGNVQITGGTSGQALTTNGSGVLSWATPGLSLTSGSATLGASVVISTTTEVPIMTFTIPSAGTWLVSYSMNIFLAISTGEARVSLYVSNNATSVFTPNSATTLWMNSSGFNGLRSQLAQSFIVTTTAPTVYKVAGYLWATTVSVTVRQNDGTLSASAVNWVKIA